MVGSIFIKLYADVPNSNLVIKTAHKLRNENPLAHSSAGLIDSDSSSAELMNIQNELDCLINQYALNKNL